MSEKASDFDDFLIATILADLFDPTGSENLEFVSKKIVDGLIENGSWLESQVHEKISYSKNITLKI